MSNTESHIPPKPEDGQNGVTDPSKNTTQETKEMSNTDPTKNTTQKTKEMNNTESRTPPKTKHRKLRR
jgi:hypothetical protein